MSQTKRSRYCNVEGCINESGTRNAEFKFFRTPMRGTLRKLWMEKFSARQTVHDVFTYFTVCSLHFTQNDFNANNKLKANAIPSIFPDNSVCSINKETVIMSPEVLVISTTKSEMKSDPLDSTSTDISDYDDDSTSSMSEESNPIETLYSSPRTRTTLEKNLWQQIIDLKSRLWIANRKLNQMEMKCKRRKRKINILKSRLSVFKQVKRDRKQ